ncbi:MAG: DUF2927 domain-containing protein [Thermohalobaculum sp.]|nr:DUF2927 domain-containing protein [Thermohalobaculum sp.]
MTPRVGARSGRWQAGALAALALAAGCAPYQDGASWAGYALHRREAGGLRTDRAAPDLPFDERVLERDFLTVALGAEPNPVGAQPGERTLAAGVLRRWQAPIRWTLADDSLTAARDGPLVERTLTRLAAITGHDIAPAGDEAANLYVFFLRPQDYATITADPPDWPSGRWLAGFIDRFGRAPDTPCVATFSASGPDAPGGPHRIAFAVVLIRAELPASLAEACIEEELSQTMGLPNDDPGVRPSIFNDDEEFALLTRHDEALLRILYDPRLEPGMTEADLAPLLPRVAADHAR